MDFLLIQTASDLVGINTRELTSYLNRHGVDTHLLFLNREYYEELTARDLDSIASLASSARLAGISLLSNYGGIARQVIRHLKENLGIPIILGGVHPTIAPKQCLEMADYVCAGEGENALLELFRQSRDKRQVTMNRPIQGLWYNADGRTVEMGFTKHLENLDDVGGQEFSPERTWFLTDGRIEHLEKDVVMRAFKGKISLFASRGCPFDCTYCVNSYLNRVLDRPTIRCKSVAQVIRELALYKEAFPEMFRFRFHDDAFMALPLSWMTEFAEIYKRKISLPFDVPGVNPLLVKKEKFDLLVKAGLVSIRMGIQSGSDRVRKSYARRETNRELTKKFEILKRADLSVRLDIILDNPWESLQDKIDSLLFVNSFPKNSKVNFFSLTFYPGTEVFRRAKEEGLFESYEEYLSGFTNKSIKINYINALNKYVAGRRASPARLKWLTHHFVVGSWITKPIRLYFIIRYRHRMYLPRSLVANSRGGVLVRSRRSLPGLWKIMKACVKA